MAGYLSVTRGPFASYGNTPHSNQFDALIAHPPGPHPLSTGSKRTIEGRLKIALGEERLAHRSAECEKFGAVAVKGAQCSVSGGRQSTAEQGRDGVAYLFEHLPLAGLEHEPIVE